MKKHLTLAAVAAGFCLVGGGFFNFTHFETAILSFVGVGAFSYFFCSSCKK